MLGIHFEGNLFIDSLSELYAAIFAAWVPVVRFMFMGVGNRGVGVRGTMREATDMYISGTAVMVKLRNGNNAQARNQVAQGNSLAKSHFLSHISNSMQI